MPTRSGSKQALDAKQVRAISRAIADPRRYEILRHIADGDRHACTELRACFPITPATLSHHLRELELAGLIAITRRGKFADLHFCRDTWSAYLSALASL